MFRFIPRTMNWPDFQRIVRVRAVEETDQDRRILSSDNIRLASQEASRVEIPDPQFLLDRARQLEEWAETPLRNVAPSAGSAYRGFVFLILMSAFVFGCLTSVLGQEKQVNLLSIPVLTILIWNAVVITLSLIAPWVLSWISDLIGEAWKYTRGRLACKHPQVTKAPPDEHEPTDSLHQLVQKLSGELAARRRLLGRRALLHTGASMIAIGSIVAMYGHGWSREYQAVWESTLLNVKQASSFFRVVYGPASKVTGIPVPLDEVPTMHRTQYKPADRPATAKPWITLYAFTMLLGIVLPRWLLAGWDCFRMTRLQHQVLRGSCWHAYIKKKRSEARLKGSEPAWLIHHGYNPSAEELQEWCKMIKIEWPAVGEVHSPKWQSRADFIKDNRMPPKYVACAFTLDTTPEATDHGALVDALRCKLGRDVPVLFILDATQLENQFPNQFIEMRVPKERNWMKTIKWREGEALLRRANGKLERLLPPSAS